MNIEPSEQMGQPTQESIQGLIHQISYPLYNCKGWLKFLGVMFIIGGIIYAITIILLIIAWVPIWMGVLLFQSATAAEVAHETGSDYELVRSLSKLKTYFIIMGVLTLISIIFSILFFILGFMGAFMTHFRM